MPSDNVELLQFPENIKRRPGMYVGDMNETSILLREAIDNSIDELYSGMDRGINDSCNKIWIEAVGDSYLVADNGRGIPIKESVEKGITMARLAVSNLSAGSKFQKNSMAIGMNGCGISCVNALSTNFTIMSRLKLHNLDELPKKLKDKVPETITDTTYYFCSFEEGYLKDEGFKEFKRDTFNGEYPSTITTYTPSKKYYHSTKARIPSSLQFVKYILDKSNHPSDIYINGKPFKDSYKGFKYNLDCTIDTAEENAKNPTLRFLISLGFQEKLEPCQVVGSVNGLDCKAGFHIKLAQTAFDKAFSKMFSDCNRTEFMGMDMGIICLCNEPEFSSQTKERMSGADGFRCSEREGKHEIEILAKAFMKLMKDNFDDFKAHEAKILEYMKSTEKIGRKEFIKSSVLIAANTSRPEAFIPNKLIDCSTVNRQEAELFICEGLSAAGSLVKSRDPRIHAILPLRGKPLNTASLEIERVLSNKEMKDLISSIGVGVNDYHDLSEVRYGKVVIVADADPDGKNINALCLGALATHLTFLVEAGYVYIAETPLYQQDDKYYFDRSELKEGRPFSRFKGLGEANPEDLKPFVFDKGYRRLIKVTMDNWEVAQEMLTSSRAKREIMVQKGVIKDKLVYLDEMKED